jgi:hypothetical protein
MACATLTRLKKLKAPSSTRARCAVFSPGIETLPPPHSTKRRLIAVPVEGSSPLCFPFLRDDRERNTAPILRDCVGTGLALPSARLRICLVAKIADQRVGLGVYAFNSRASARQQRPHFGPILPPVHLLHSPATCATSSLTKDPQAIRDFTRVMQATWAICLPVRHFPKFSLLHIFVSCPLAGVAVATTVQA